MSRLTLTALLMLVASSHRHLVAADGTCGNTGESNNGLNYASLTASFSADSKASYGGSLDSFFLPPSVCTVALNSSAMSAERLMWPASAGYNSWRGACTVVDPARFALIFSPGSTVTVSFGTLAAEGCRCSSLVPTSGVVAGVIFTLQASASAGFSSNTFLPSSCTIAFAIQPPTLGSHQPNVSSFAITYVAETTATATGTVLFIAVIVVPIVLIACCMIGVVMFCCCPKRSQPSKPMPPRESSPV